jgi:hypothetical protein
MLVPGVLYYSLLFCWPYPFIRRRCRFTYEWRPILSIRLDSSEIAKVKIQSEQNLGNVRAAVSPLKPGSRSDRGTQFDVDRCLRWRVDAVSLGL